MTSGSYARSMRDSLIGALVLVTVMAGCSQGETGASVQTVTSPRSGERDVPQRRGDSTPATDAEWKAVIDDWYDNGKVDAPHRCVAVRAAIERLPPRSPASATEDLRRVAQVFCHAKAAHRLLIQPDAEGTVFAVKRGMTTQQVLALAGKPDRVGPLCWLYHATRVARPEVTGMRICFSKGHVAKTQISVHG
jgi:hypothetical protein